MSTKIKVAWTVLVMASLTFQIAVALVLAGHDATPYGTRDSNGYPLGFNDPITVGHVTIMLSRVTFDGFVTTVGSYVLFGYFMHLAALFLIWTRMVDHGLCQIYFLAQILIFPVGWNPLVWAMWISLLPPFGPVDGECVQDGPIHPIFATVSWWLLSGLFLVWHLLREDLTKWHPKFKPCGT